MKKIKVTWINSQGEKRAHTIFNESLTYAKAWWREAILESRPTAFMTVDQKRNCKMQFISAEFI